ncbi:MAG: OadG family protein [Clostridiales bacterium]|nr:OadG family protein [Clostridiales bacterium]
MNPISMIVVDTGWEFTATVVIAGIGIVLGMLLLLILVFYLFGMIVSKSENRAKEKAAKKAGKEEEVQIPVPTVPQMKKSEPAPTVEQGIPNEVVAAIAAAVAVSQGPDAVVRTIKRKNVSGRNPWAAAAVRDNNRPF